MPKLQSAADAAPCTCCCSKCTPSMALVASAKNTHSSYQEHEKRRNMAYTTSYKATLLYKATTKPQKITAARFAMPPPQKFITMGMPRHVLSADSPALGCQLACAAGTSNVQHALQAHPTCLNSLITTGMPRHVHVKLCGPRVIAA
jgi:hypothetical protein